MRHITDQIIEGFKDWIILQNYEPTTSTLAPKIIYEFRDWCISHQIATDTARCFFEYQKRRKNKLKEGGLSVAYLRVYLRILRMFRRYLREVLSTDLDINIIYKESEVKHHHILTKEEIEGLYEEIEDDVLGMRDRAMLAVYYGCGLRRNEGASLLLEDIMPDKNLLYVRKGKNYKQRYVPMIGRGRKDILDYLTIARPSLIYQSYESSFFIGIRGKKIRSSALYERLKRLVRKAGIDKPIGLHSLRHSLATHLLQNGMPLHQIGKLLGHSTLDTTQIYTHIINDPGYYGSQEDLSV